MNGIFFFYFLLQNSPYFAYFWIYRIDGKYGIYGAYASHIIYVIYGIIGGEGIYCFCFFYNVLVIIV